MATLLIQDLDDAVYALLERRARVRGRTVEEEARETLQTRAAPPADVPQGENLAELATRFFGPRNGFELDLPPRSADIDRPPPDFSGPEYDR